jgi:hypothetical protein
VSRIRDRRYFSIKGKIRRIEAVLTQSPYAMDSGWSSRDDGLSDRARDVTGAR